MDRRVSRDPSKCRICGFTLGHDEGLAGGICDSCDEEIVQHQRDQEAEWDADDGDDGDDWMLEAELDEYERRQREQHDGPCPTCDGNN